jgi:hypothetical protein
MSGVTIAAEPAHGQQGDIAPPPRLDFEIVPRKGLIVVAVVFVAVIVAIASDKLWPLTFLHVAFGAAWTIIDLFLGLVLGPILGRLSIPARIELTTRLMPKMLLIMPTVVTVALVAGAGIARTGERGGVGRAQEAAATAGGDRAADEALHLLGGNHRRAADLDPRDHDQAGLGMSAVPTSSEQRLPPVTEIGMVSLALIVAGGIYLSAHLPDHVPLGPAVVLLTLSALLLVGNLAALSRVKGFAWHRFFQIGKWALLAYAITAGMIEYAFLQNHLRGGALVVLTLSLVVYAVHVPMLIAFTVARYEVPGDMSVEPDAVR